MTTRVPAAALAQVRAALRGIRRPLVLIDGPSGAGKSTFADLLIADWPGRAPDLVRLDDVYPGWHGLEPAVRHVERELVRPWLSGEPGRRQGWDWVLGRPSSITHVLPGRALVIEGCGAHRTAGSSDAVVRVRLEAAYAERRDRALTRDAGAFDPYWELWEGQWRRSERRAGAVQRRSITVRLG
ncbi:ATP-binding protein [Agromyces sp. NPDC058110]|uniref:ATP-binding protein n=1 Tax=Agromyces sp. NPDC058110 TaxID=3346345 RepID=UPI0036D8ABC5